MAGKDRRAYMRTWRKKNPDKVKAARDKYHKESIPVAGNEHKRWTKAEIRQIMAEDRPCDLVLGERLGRSQRAIQAKRHAVKKAKQNEEAKRRRAEARAEQKRLAKLAKQSQADMSGNC